MNELVEAADEKMLAKTIARYGRVDLLCIDELCYMELDQQSVGTPAEQNNRRTARSLIRKTCEVGSAALLAPGSTIVLYGPNSGGGDP